MIGTTRLPVVVEATILTGANRTFDHRADDLEVGRIERERQVHFATRRHHVGREALVILHVTRSLRDRQFAFELVEQLARVLAENVDEHVETPAMRHAR